MSQTKSEQLESHISCRFQILKKIGSGAYGHVWKVSQKHTKKVYALKKIFDAFQHSTDAQRTYRQIEILQQIEHPNVVKLYETIPAQNNRDVYLVFQFMESDLHNAIGDNILKDAHFRYITYQIAKALKYLHSGLILHRDLKPSNILINSDCSIKLCDFGLVRSLINLNDGNPVLTQGVATRWYRAPEVLLGSKRYSTPADVWSFGCIIFEALVRKPLFPGSSTLDQLQRIIKFTGSPSEEDIYSLESEPSLTMLKEIKSNYISLASNMMKSIPLEFQDLISKMIVFNPKKRITIGQLLQHSVVKSFRKKEQEIICIKIPTTTVDDNKKLTTEEYRKLIYAEKITKTTQKVLRRQISHKSIQFIPQQINEKPKLNQNSNPVLSKNISQIKSCQNINEKFYVGSQVPIRSSWKELLHSPEQALKSKNNIVTKNNFEVGKFIGKKGDEKPQIEKSDKLDNKQYNIKNKKSEPFLPQNNIYPKKPTFGAILWNSVKNNVHSEKVNNIQHFKQPNNL